MIDTTFEDNSEKFFEADRAARFNGLLAATQVLINAVKRGLRGGYTSGKFTTGNVINSVTRGELETDYDDVMTMRVGSNVPYALFWELGHHNTFTRKFERVPVWVPAITGNLEQIRAAYARQYVATMKRMGF